MSRRIETVSRTNVMPDYHFMRQNYPRQAAEHLRRPMQVRNQLGADRIIDLHYANLVRSPMATMRALYASLGDELTPAAEAAMSHWLEANPQGKFGKHAYSLEKYGLTVADLRPHFEEYLETYEVEAEG